MVDRLRHWFRAVLRWLRRPRLTRGRPVVCTPTGHPVPSMRHVPIRSTKADAKREALAFARTHFGDDTLTWGQARKRLRRLEANLRGAR